MAETWYVARDGERYGPYTWDGLISQARSGQLAGTDLVWSPSLGEWTRANQVPGLLSTARGQPPPPPPRESGRRPRRMPRNDNKKLFLIAGGGLLAAVVLACAGAFLLLRDEVGELFGEEPPVEAAGELPFWEEDAESVLGDLDDPDWRNYPDREEEEAAIARTIDGFGEAMKRGDLDGSVAFILEERRDAYRELFSTNPAAMASFADLIADGEMSFLSEGGGSTSYQRIAEYAVDLDGFTFYVVFRKVDDTWVLYDF